MNLELNACGFRWIMVSVSMRGSTYTRLVSQGYGPIVLHVGRKGVTSFSKLNHWKKAKMAMERLK